MKEHVPLPGPHLSFKRPYKKSTQGCKACKLRKVKCDEGRPVCSNCKKRFLDPVCCNYSPLDSSERALVAISRRPRTSLMPTVAPEPVLERPISNVPSGSNAHNILELRLMHNYTQSTSGHMDGGSLRSPDPYRPLCLWNTDLTWEVDIPQIAFSSEMVLNALLSLSATNLLAQNPEDRTVKLAAGSYFQKALALQRAGLENINHENAQPLIVAAVLNAHNSWLQSHSQDQDKGYTIPFETFRMCIGATALYQAVAPWFMKHVDDHQGDQSQPYDESIPKQPFYQAASESVEKILETLRAANTNAKDYAAYESAAAEALWGCAAISQKMFPQYTIEARITSVLHRVPYEFIILLEKEDPIAMSLLAHNLALLDLFEEKTAWWMHGAGSCRVTRRAIPGIRAKMPEDLLWCMDWPLKIMLGEFVLEKSHVEPQEYRPVLVGLT